MKWKNIDIGACCYYITGTFTEWLPLMQRDDICAIVCEEIARALGEHGASLVAYVLMPDHVHLLVWLPESGLHQFCKRWRGTSARRILDSLLARHDAPTLHAMARHAHGRSQYAVWKEQVRALAVWHEKKLHTMVNYIHANPVRRGLVATPDEWPHSSFGFYARGVVGPLPVAPLAV